MTGGFPFSAARSDGTLYDSASDLGVKRLLHEGIIAEAIKSGRARNRTYSGPTQEVIGFFPLDPLQQVLT